MNKATVRQHYVPRTYLKHFANNVNEKFFLNTLFQDKEDIIEVNIDNLALEKHLYTIETFDGDRNQKVETFYSKIETNYNELYSKLNSPNAIYLTIEEKQNLILFVISLYLRTPTTHSSIVEHYETIIDQAHHLSNSKKVTINNYLVLDFENKTVEQIKKEFKLISKVEFNLESLSTLMTFSKLRFDNTIFIAELSDNENFITSDNPVIVPNNKNTNDNNIYLPINNKKILILVVPNGDNVANSLLVPKMQLENRESKEAERLYNGFQLENSIRTIFGKQDAIIKSVNQMSEFDKLQNTNFCKYKIGPAANTAQKAMPGDI
jgi:hypothetical protein